MAIAERLFENARPRLMLSMMQTQPTKPAQAHARHANLT
jgi:hypothetical protein